MKKIAFGFILGVLVCSGVVFAATLLDSRDVTYRPNNSNFDVNNVESALDELYEKVNNKASVALYSAAADEVYYYNNGNKVILGKTDDTGKLMISPLKPGEYTIYSSVASNPDNLSEPYSKTLVVTQKEDLYIMPDNTIYWYGYIDGTIRGTCYRELNNLSVSGGSTSYCDFQDPINLTSYTKMNVVANGYVYTRGDGGRYYTYVFLYDNINHTGNRITSAGIFESMRKLSGTFSGKTTGYVSVYEEGSSSWIKVYAIYFE